MAQTLPPQRDEPVAQLDRNQGEFLQLCAQLLSLALHEAPALPLSGRPLDGDGHRERTQRVSVPKVLSERRREAVLQYREFFEASADGMMVLDARGEVLAEPRAEGLREIASRLGHDLGQMRLQFNAKGYLPGPGYRDDHRWMWPSGADDRADAAPARPPPGRSADEPPVR